MAMDLQNGHANGAPAPPSRLGSKQLIDRHACHRLRCCALSANTVSWAAISLQNPRCAHGRTFDPVCHPPPAEPSTCGCWSRR